MPSIVQTYAVLTPIRSSGLPKAGKAKVGPLSILNNHKISTMGEIKNDSIFLIFRHFYLNLTNSLRSFNFCFISERKN